MQAPTAPAGFSTDRKAVAGQQRHHDEHQEPQAFLVPLSRPQAARSSITSHMTDLL